MFSEESWKAFCQKNFQRFSRYCRDQCLEAKRYFSQKNIKHEILQEALCFYLENDTLSFTNLKDTYDYVLNIPEKLDIILPELPLLSPKGQPVSVKVHQRKVAVYQELMKKEVAR